MTSFGEFVPPPLPRPTLHERMSLVSVLWEYLLGQKLSVCTPESKLLHQVSSVSKPNCAYVVFFTSFSGVSCLEQGEVSFDNNFQLAFHKFILPFHYKRYENNNKKLYITFKTTIDLSHFNVSTFISTIGFGY